MKPRLLNTARLSFPLATALAALLAVSSSYASTLYWDGTTSTANADGGNGSWNDNSSTNWDTLAQGGADSVWLNSVPDLAVFGGTAGTVSLTSAITAGGITFNTTGYTLAGDGAQTLSFATGDNIILFNNIAAASTSNGGTAGLKLGGAGNVILSASNPFTAGSLTLQYAVAGDSSTGWSGTTTINAGMTLALNGRDRSLFSTSGITLNGGGITLTNTNSTQGAFDRVSSNAITANGGTFTYTNTSGSGLIYGETIGAVDLNRGQTNFALTNDMVGGGGNIQTLTLTDLTRTGATNTSVINFSATTTGPNATTNIIKATGASGPGPSGSTASVAIIGPWATSGASNTTLDYAVYDGSGNVRGANISTTAENSGFWIAGNNVSNGGAITLTGSRTINTLRYTGANNTIALGGNTLATYGILAGGVGAPTVTSTAGGLLTTPTGGNNTLYLTTGVRMDISAPINNNGSAVTVVKSGAGEFRPTSTASTFSGGIVLNGGTLFITNDSQLGVGGGITVNGAVTINGGDQYNLARTLTLNDGASLTSNNGFGVTGVFSGNGALNVTSADDHNFTNAANTYSGPIQSATSANIGYGLKFNSIGDLAGAGLITLVGGSGTFHWMSASGSTTTLANRQFAISGTGSGMISARGTTAASNLVINKDLLITGASGARTLTLEGTNAGNNTFAGKIANGTDGGASVVSLTKSNSGLWILTGSNTYSGTTTLGGGTLVVSSSANLGDGSATNSLIFNTGTLQANGTITSPSTRGVTMTGAGTINTNGNAVTLGGIITGGGALTKTGANDLTLSNANTFTGTTTVSAGKVVITNALALQNSAYTTTGSNGTTIGLDVTSGLSSGNLTLGGLAGAVNLVSAFTAGFTGTVTQLTLNPQAGISNTYSAAIANGSMALAKTGAGTQVLSGTNTYSGATTISAGILNVNSTSALGNSSGTNTLIFNGGTLQAAAAITSVALRGVTMTSTGIIDTNGFAVSIAGDIGGAGGLTKNGINSTLTLSGTNSYNGVTTVNAGTLAIANEAALASNTAAKLNVKGGASLQLSVNAAGTNGFTVANLDTLLGNISVANTAAQGLQLGAGLIIDTTNAGGSFTQGNAFTDSTGAFGGKISLTKTGTGTLVLDETNTYTGTTTISAGTLEVTGSIATSSNIINNATLLFNSGSAQSFTNPITGTGTISKSGAGTLTLAGSNTISGSTTVNTGSNLTLSNALALRNSALVTTGGGTVTLSGVTSPTFGGLSGASGNLADIIIDYSTVTNITLNPPTGITHTYGGVIGEGMTGMTLTKTGAGTQVLTGANLYTGATIINQGTLNLGGATATGSLASTVLTLSGGILSYTRTGTNTQSFTTTNITSGANQVTTSLATQTLELNNIVRSVGGTVNFGNTGTITTTNAVSNSIIGGWATVNNDNWATKTGDNITALGVYTGANATAATNLNTNMDAGTVTIGGVINTNSIRFSGGSVKTLTLAAGDNIIQSGGILVRSDVGNNASTITGGNLLGSASGDLIIHQHNTSNSLTIASVIKNNGGATALTKSGAGNLILSGLNSYTGGFYLNAGSVSGANGTLTPFGSGTITVAGSGTSITPVRTDSGFAAPGYTFANNMQVNEGASVSLTNGNQFTSMIMNGVLSGSGTVIHETGAGGAAGFLTFANSANTFTGILRVNNTANGNGLLTVNSLPDSANPIQLNGSANQAIFALGAGTATSLLFNNRQIELNGTVGGIINNANTTASNTITIGTDLLVSAAGAKTLTLGGANTGTNTFSGKIGNGASAVVSLTKADAGTWILGAANTFTGSTTVTAGRLSLNNLNAVATTSSVTVSSGGTLGFPIAGTYNIPGTINIAGVGATLPGGNGALWFGQGGSYSSTLNNPVNMTAAATIGSFGNVMAPTLGGAITGTGPLTISSQGGTVADKATWTLGAASTYSGNTLFTNNNGLVDITVKLGVDNALPVGTSLSLQAATITLAHNAFTTFDLNGKNQTLAGLTDATGAANTGATFNKRVINSSGTLSTLTLNIAGSVTYGTSGTRVTAGTIGGLDASGAAANNVALTKTGAGDLTLGGANTYTGDTTISNGRIVANAIANASSGATRIVQSGTGAFFSSGTGQNFANNFNISTVGYQEAGDLTVFDGAIRSDGNNTFSGTITLSGNSRIGAFGLSRVNTISGKITGSFAMSFYGLNNANADTQTYILTNTANDYTGDTQIDNKDYQTARTGNSTTLRLGASDVIPNVASGGNVAFGGASADDLTVLDLFGFSDTINGLTVTAAAGARITNSVAGASVLSIGANNTTSSFGGSITNTTGTLAITKIGNGILTLSGTTNTYAGATTVSAGTLAVTGSLGATAVSVDAGTLSGNGNFGGNVSIASGARHAFAVAATAVAQDTTVITGTLALTSGNILDLTAASTPAPGEYVLATATTAITGTPTTINYNGIPGTVTVDTVSNPKRLLLTVTAGTPYSIWAGTFLPSDVSNPALNLDGDTLTNLQEFAFGTNPTVSSGGSIVWVNGGAVTTPGVPVAINFANPGVDYRAVFGRRKDYVAAGLTYTVQFSAGLDVWVNSPTTPTVLTGAGGLNPSEIEAVSVPYPLLIDVGGNNFKKPTFFRVEVTN